MEANPYGVAALWQEGDAVIKGVALLLLLMSVMSWYVLLRRTLGFLKLRRAAVQAQPFWHEQSFEQGLALLSNNIVPAYHFLATEAQAAAEHHQQHQADLHGRLPLADWLTACLRNALDDITAQQQRGLAILASVGSTAPFIGLFGTVWGIYHALVGIGVSGQVGIDKVAGPVGEALIMTAFGLAVAIPAVLGYNAMNRVNKGEFSKLQRFAHQLHAYFLTGSALHSGKVVTLSTNKVREVS